MDLNNLIINTLSSLSVPVSFQVYSGAATTYITFFEYLQQGELFCDNVEENIGHYVQVDVWSKGDYTALVDSTLDALKTAGFKRVKCVDIFEEKTKFYHKAIRCFYLE